MQVHSQVSGKTLSPSQRGSLKHKVPFVTGWPRPQRHFAVTQRGPQEGGLDGDRLRHWLSFLSHFMALHFSMNTLQEITAREKEVGRKVVTLNSTSLRSSPAQDLACHHGNKRGPQRYVEKQEGEARPSTSLVQLESLSSVREMQKGSFSRWGCVIGMVITGNKMINIAPASSVCKQCTII